MYCYCALNLAACSRAAGRRAAFPPHCSFARAAPIPSAVTTIKASAIAALFYDAGTAANRWSQKSLYSGAGVGARWRSPVGPVNLDLAYGLKTRTFRPYITLGIAF